MKLRLKQSKQGLEEMLNSNKSSLTGFEVLMSHDVLPFDISMAPRT